MATDSLTTRVFKVKNKNNDASDSDNTVILKLVNSVGIAGMPKVTDETTFVDERSFSVTTENEPYDKEYEDANDGNARFKHVATLATYYRDVPVSIYYDYKYGDLFILPNLDTVDETLITSGAIEIDGFQIGNNRPMQNVGRDFNGNVVAISLPEPTEQLTVKLQTFNLHGIVSSFDSRIRKDYNETSVYKKTNLISFIKVKRTDIFGDNKLPLMVIRSEELTKYTVRYGGYKEPEYIYIPIPL